MTLAISNLRFVASSPRLGPRNFRKMVIVPALFFFIAACSTIQTGEQTSMASYSFDNTKAKKAYEAGVTEDKNGNGKAAIIHFQRAIDLFPVYPEAYRAMAVTAKRIGDQGRLRYATFFESHLELISKLGARGSARVFENAARDDSINRIKDPRIRKTAQNIAAFLDAVACEEARKAKEEAEERSPIISRYSYESIFRLLEYLTENPSRECSSVTFH